MTVSTELAWYSGMTIRNKKYCTVHIWKHTALGVMY